MAFEINATGLQDPTNYVYEGKPEGGTYVDGAPIYQELETCVLIWAAMDQSDYTALWNAWNTNKGNLVAGEIPMMSAATYRSITAYFHQPIGEAAGGIRRNVRMRVTFIS